MKKKHTQPVSLCCILQKEKKVRWQRTESNRTNAKQTKERQNERNGTEDTENTKQNKIFRKSLQCTDTYETPSFNSRFKSRLTDESFIVQILWIRFEERRKKAATTATTMMMMTKEENNNKEKASKSTSDKCGMNH